MKEFDMRKSLIQRILVYGFLVLLCWLNPMRGWGQNVEKTVDALVELGFENVGFSETDTERVFIIQNTAYKLNGVGIGKAVDVVQENGMPDDKACRIVVLDNNVPQISLVCYARSEADSDGSVSRRDWDVSYELGDSWKQASKAKRKNSSLYKVDVVIYPELSYKNGKLSEIYQILLNLNPTIEVSFWKGMKAEAQLIIPVINDYGMLYKQVRMGMITLSQTVRLPHNVFLTGAVGTFSNFRWGADLRAKYILEFDERFSFEGRIGYTGAARMKDWRWKVSKPERLMWNVAGNFYWPKFNTQFQLKYEKYVYGEKGVQAQMIRHFRHASIGFWGAKTWGYKNSGRLVGFLFQVALPPYKMKRRGYIPRVTTSSYMGLRNAGERLSLPQTYKTQPWDNVARENSFNPIFIKSELLNY